jgi:hypothetical protein
MSEYDVDKVCNICVYVCVCVCVCVYIYMNIFLVNSCMYLLIMVKEFCKTDLPNIYKYIQISIYIYKHRI